MPQVWRKGDSWYLAGVNGQNRPREERVSLGAWLAAGHYELTRIGDGKDPRSFGSQTEHLEPGQGFSAKMLPYGGFVATLRPGK